MPPAAIGIWKGQLVIKLRRRKLMAGGSRVVCSCICGGYSKAHVPLSGVHLRGLIVLTGVPSVGADLPAGADGRAYVS